MGDAMPEPLYGQRLAPVLIDERARFSPDKVFCEIPVSGNLHDGFKSVTYADLARAINRTAEWLETTFGRSENFATLAYMGVSDVRYFCIAVAASKIGWKTFFPSPRNSLEAQIHLFKAIDTIALITSRDYPVSIELRSQLAIKVAIIPELDELLAPAPAKLKEYAFAATFEEAKHQPFVVIHTSGSTGLPKPVILTYGWTGTSDAQRNMSWKGAQGQFSSFAGSRQLTFLPPFHAAGLVVSLFGPLWLDIIIIWAPPSVPPSAVLADEILSITKIDVLLQAPSIIEDLAKSPKSLAKLEKLKGIAYAGRPLPYEAGEKLCRKVPIYSLLGSTEIGAAPVFTHDVEDWEYLRFCPAHKGVVFQPVGDGSYELVLKRHPSSDPYHSAFHTFPNKLEFSMNDIYVPHPSKPELWRYIGRADDIIVFSNGEKLNPVCMEGTLRKHPLVKGALVVGQGKFSAAAIIELTEESSESLRTPEDRAAFIEAAIWPLAVEANKDTPGHGHLQQHMMMLNVPGKPFIRTPKGTIVRGKTAKIYAEEIDELYRRSEKDEEAIPTEQIDISSSNEILEQKIAHLIASTTESKSLGRDQDLFAAGLDSLHVMQIVRQLKATITGVEKEEICTRIIYTNPTISRLIKALKSFSIVGSSRQNLKSREQIMEETLNSFAKQLPRANHTVIITGSTGSLGSYLLHTLLASPEVTKIYCLNRRTNAAQVQLESNSSKGLNTEWDCRVEFLHADLNKADLGLPPSDYQRLKKEATIIIHNQWQVDFNLALASFQPHIDGTLNLIHLSALSSRNPPIFFISSVATITNWASKHDTELVPESALADPSMTGSGGYGESKWIAERLLDKARGSGVSAAILRVGQVAGPVKVGITGVWNKTEWLPSIIASSGYLGVLPANLHAQDTIPWVPVDIMARTIIDLVRASHISSSSSSSSTSATTSYYHLANPNPSKWASLIPTIQAYFSQKKEIRVVSLAEWVEILAESAARPDVDPDKNPAVKLLDFYQGLSKSDLAVTLGTEKTREQSRTLRELGPVSAEWMALWLKQWRF